ncbi:Telomerase Cajal body protein 1 [Perkinsus olseni]|uniref:Telomerase Cajal body protein 1 n=2 Tax=Perkinsus olseni TaxID=32597 RepID=A0A7J6T6V2_PEROL|nr:Telomerase Cajal body protein 1 [Perkinsus olseni]
MTDSPPPSISCDTAGAVSTPYDDYNGSYNNYPRGVYWAPRGKHLMSYFADNTCRVFDADQGLVRPVRTERAPGTITAMEMCPLGSEPSDFHYAVSVRDRPIHLVNLLTGEVAASYQGFSVTDEVTAASCLSFSQDGSRLLGGVAGQPQVWLWDLTRPGKSTYHRVLSTRKGKTGQRGIVSAAAWLDDKCYALGTYSRTIGIYDERQGSKKNAKCVKMLSAPDGGGITSLKLSPQGLLVSGHRTDTCMRVWDLRSSGTEPVTTLPRATKTNQRFDFSFLGNSRILATGDDSGHVLWYDILTGERLSSCLVSSSGTSSVAAQIEPVSCNRIAIATGQRVWPTYVSMGDDENTELVQPKTDNRVAVVKFSAPEGLPSATLPSTAEVAPQRQEQAETAPASAPEEAVATLPNPPEPQSVDVPDTFKGLPPPPGVPAPPPCSEAASNEAIAGSAESLPSQAQTEADAGRLPEAPAGEKTDDVDMVDAANA